MSSFHRVGRQNNSFSSWGPRTNYPDLRPKSINNMGWREKNKQDGTAWAKAGIGQLTPICKWSRTCKSVRPCDWSSIVRPFGVLLPKVALLRPLNKSLLYPLAPSSLCSEGSLQKASISNQSLPLFLIWHFQLCYWKHIKVSGKDGG